MFKHTGISWEWGIVFIEAFLFFLGVETWKWGKRVFFRRRAAKDKSTPEDLEATAFGEWGSVGESEGSEITEKRRV